MDEKITADKVESMYKSAENWQDLRQQLININFYEGNQWIGWDKSSKQIKPLPREDGITRATRNKIRKVVLTLLAKHLKSKIKYNVTPASREQRDIDAAKAANKFLDVLWNELGFSQKTREIFLYKLVQKRSWLKTWFDAEAGEDISPTPEDGDIYDDWVEAGAKPIHKGDIRAKVCDTLTVFADPSAKTEDEIRWIIERYGKDVDDIKEEYGVEVSADKNVFSYRYTLATEERPKVENMATVYELWMKPCKKYPDGAMVVMCDGKIIYENYESGELPYQLFGYIPVPGSILYEAVVTDLIDPQKEINTIRSMIATTARKMGNSIWTNPIGSTVDEDDLTNEISQVLNYIPVNGAKPERVPAPDLPSYFANELAHNAVDFDDMSGAREISQGRLPTGLDTASGLELMVEQENEKMAVASQNYEQGMKKVMKRLLRLAKAHYTEERQLRLLGEGSEIEVFAFNGSDLTGEEDINIVQGSSLPELKAAQQDRIMSLWGAGAIVDEEGRPDHKKFLQLMGMGDSNELFEQDILDINNAKMENEQFEKMANNEEAMRAMQEYQQLLALQQSDPNIQVELPPLDIPRVWESDEHSIHVREHNIFRKTLRYRQLPEQVRMLVDQHYHEHLQALQAPIQQQQQMMMQQQQAQQESQMQMKQMDTQTALQKEQLKSETQIAVASLRR